MSISIFGMTLNDWRNIFTIIGVIAALVVYVLNSLAQKRQRAIDNALRYLQFLDRLYPSDGYVALNLKAMEAGTFKRDLNNDAMELKFHEFLSACEYVALAHRAGAAPSSLNAYMLGWTAKHIYPQLTDREKAEPYWELAVDLLRETKLSADKLDCLTKEERLEYFKKKHFK